MCQDASARAVTRSSGACALLKGGHRLFLVPSANLHNHRSALVCRRWDHPAIADQHGRTGQDRAKWPHTAAEAHGRHRQTCAGAWRRSHADRPDAHAADGRFSTPWGGHRDVWALSARALRSHRPAAAIRARGDPVPGAGSASRVRADDGGPHTACCAVQMAPPRGPPSLEAGSPVIAAHDTALADIAVTRSR